MTSAWLTASRPLLIAHRGARAVAPENTLAAFARAAEQGADGIECDVRATADGQLVVIHDATLERTTDAVGEVARLTLAEVRRADAGIRGGASSAGERVPTLDEVLALARGRLLVDLELKVAGIEAQVAGSVARAGMTEAALITSFLEEALTATQLRAPALALGLLQVWADVPRAVDLGIPVYLPAVRALSAGVVRACRAAGLRIVPWTVRTEDEARAALDYGVDGMIADDPRLLRRVIGER